MQCFIFKFISNYLVKRNQRGDDRLYVACNSDGYKFISKLFKDKTDTNEENVMVIEGVKGTILIAEDSVTTGGYYIHLLFI